MKILGIHDGHNATAALIINGKIEVAISEERLTYKKNDMGFPKNSIDKCLELTGVRGVDIDAVAFSIKSLPLHYLRVKREYAFSIRDWLNEQEFYWKPLLFDNVLNTKYIEKVCSNEKFKNKQWYNYEDIPLILSKEENDKYLEDIRYKTLLNLYGIDKEKIFFIDHHSCHQYYAYFASPYRNKRTLLFTCDGGGDNTNGTVAIAENDTIKELGRNNNTDLARIYRYITLILGMKIGEHEYKVMGLAPYSSQYEIQKCNKAFQDIFHVPDILIEYKNRPSDLFFYFRDLLADCRFDGIAGAVQQMVEEVGSNWFDKVAKKLKIDRVVFSGGLSMNVKLNKKIGELNSINEIYCPTSGGDESTAIGACYYTNSLLNKPIIQKDIRNNYLGLSYTNEDIRTFISQLSRYNIQEGFTIDEIADLLAKNIVIARFAGKMEFGARSLGNRSIIANPSNENIVKKINTQIKFRDFWMPFAPSILDSYVQKYLVNPKQLMSDQMTQTFDVTDLGKKDLIAALHPFDYTVRAHIVSRELNPDYYDLIKVFSQKTGIGALLNTSFNLHGLPIVCSPKNAIHVFDNCELDAMIIGDFLITR